MGECSVPFRPGTLMGKKLAITETETRVYSERVKVITMSYQVQVPEYVVTLPCHHKFRSPTPVMVDPEAEGPSDGSFHVTLDGTADTQPGVAWMWCGQCARWYAMEAWELDEYQQAPRDALGRRLPESRLAKMRDDAQIRDRIAEALTMTGGVVPMRIIAANNGVKVLTVKRVAEDLGMVETRPEAA